MLARSIAMQIAACPSVEAITADQMDQAWIENEKRVRPCHYTTRYCCTTTTYCFTFTTPLRTFAAQMD